MYSIVYALKRAEKLEKDNNSLQTHALQKTLDCSEK